MRWRQRLVVNLCVEQEPDEIVFRVFDVVLYMLRQICIQFFEAGATVAELGTNFFEHQVNGVAEIVAVFKRKPKHAGNDIDRNVLRVLHRCINYIKAFEVVDQFIA